MFTVVVTFFKATSFVFNFLAWMPKILVLKRKSPHLIFKKKKTWEFLAPVKSMHWTDDLTLRSSLHLHWKNFNYDSLMYTHPYTTSVSIRHLIILTRTVFVGRKFARLFTATKYSACNFVLFSQWSFLSCRYCGALQRTIRYSLLSGTKTNYLSPAVDFQRLL